MPTFTREALPMSDLSDDASALMRCYTALDAASREMLDAARAGDWDGVCRLEGACALVIARLEELGPPRSMPPHEQKERMRILRRIVERDAEIRRIGEPVPAWLDPAPAPASILLH
ncbi:flagellar protein FliT [Ramlibacter humi]|uniref:Flagellar protein FliT n=1 Tax=Ramlibacter humi TaxID=2530451 RepID=A0A4Z0CD38_9BURK|nr:flagellar protein FliT [Ramlibacter humi]TFZ08350.1 flagellar protein FliT [Ramlibacter humi]